MSAGNLFREEWPGTGQGKFPVEAQAGIFVCARGMALARGNKNTGRSDLSRLPAMFYREETPE